MKNLTADTADVVIIGGGASGMMAAVTASRRGRRVILLEPGKMPGRKLRITGKGRCNLTNNCYVREFMDNVPRNAKFLYSSLSSMTPADTMAFFEQLGVPLKTERGNRVFPVSDNAHDVANALERALKREGVDVRKTRASGIVTKDGAVSEIKMPNGVLMCESAVICTGGVSYPLTGSTGDGIRMAEELGHTTAPLVASLVPLESCDDFCAQMQGFSLKNVTLSVWDSSGKLIFSELGEMLFTHFGVSGPLVLSASAHMTQGELFGYRMSVDLKPALDEKTLDARILRDFGKYSNKAFKNALDGLAGRAMIPVLVSRSGIPEETKVHSISKEQRRDLVRLFKNFSITLTNRRPIDEAVVTSGGVDVREVDPKTMASKLVSGLYFAGEVLDVDGYTGGFNLQIAWSTGHAAGRFA